MSVWRLHTKTDISKKRGKSELIAKYCLEEEVAVIGWTLRESIYNELDENGKARLENDEKSIGNDFNNYKEIVEKNKYKTKNKNKNNIYKSFYDGKVNRNVKALAEEIEINDFIWMHSKGTYYLGKVLNGSEYSYKFSTNENDDDILKLGINNQRTNIKWYKIGDESDIPGSVSTSFNKGATLQRIHHYGIEGITEILYNLKAGISDNKIQKPRNNSQNFYSLLSPTDCEDLLYFYLYNELEKGCVCIPSTNKINTALYEFVVLNPNNRNEKIYIQVKNGNVDIDINEFKNLDGKVYLLTTGGNILNDGKIIDIKNNFIQNKNIFIVDPEEVYNFAKRAYKDKKILLPNSILRWFEYLD